MYNKLIHQKLNFTVYFNHCHTNTNLSMSLFHLHGWFIQEALAAKTVAAHEAEDSRGLWESEVKARSKLGLRVSQFVVKTEQCFVFDQLKPDHITS